MNPRLLLLHRALAGPKPERQLQLFGELRPHHHEWAVPGVAFLTLNSKIIFI